MENVEKNNIVPFSMTIHKKLIKKLKQISNYNNKPF